MNETTTDTVPRTPDPPTTSDILDDMETCTPYTVADFEDQYDASRWTIRRRLEDLHDDGEIKRKQHSDRAVTWWLDVDTGGGDADG